MLILFLLLVIAILIIVLFIQRTLLIISNRNSKLLKYNTKKERQATKDILELCKDIISTEISTEYFLTHFIEYAVRTMKGSGGAILQRRDKDYYWGVGVAGSIPPLKKTSEQIEAQLLGHTAKHTEYIQKLKFNFSEEDLLEAFGEKGFAYYADQQPYWLPERFSKEAPRILIAPLKLNKKPVGLVIIVSKNEFDSYTLTEEDGTHLLRIADLATLSLNVLNVFLERKKYEEKIQNAREEGMLQVSSGIIHNIGNAVTTASLACLGLQEKVAEPPANRPEMLIVQEIIPVLEDRLKTGTLIDFLQNDDAGRQYFSVIKELLTHLNNNREESIEQTRTLSEKLDYISEIVELQQRFVGELGTENYTKINEIVQSAVKFFSGTFANYGLVIKTDLELELPQLLLDPSMMTQVFINLIKFIADSMKELHPDHNFELQVAISKKNLPPDQSMPDTACVEFTTNNIELSEKQKEFLANKVSEAQQENQSEENYELQFCFETIKKYNGHIDTDLSHENKLQLNVFLPLPPQDGKK